VKKLVVDNGNAEVEAIATAIAMPIL